MRSSVTIASNGRVFPFDYEAARELLVDPDTFATTLHVILAGAYGEDLYDPEGPYSDTLVLWTDVREDFGIYLHEDGENRMNALLTVLTGEEFFQQIPAFLSISLALATGDLGGFERGIMEEPEFPVVLWGIYEVSLNRNMAVEEPVSLSDFSPAVQDLIIRISSEEADESPTEGLSYADRFVNETKQELLQQLTSLGVPPEVLRQIEESEETPLHDNTGTVVQNGYELTEFDE